MLLHGKLTHTIWVQHCVYWCLLNVGANVTAFSTCCQIVKLPLIFSFLFIENEYIFRFTVVFITLLILFICFSAAPSQLLLKPELTLINHETFDGSPRVKVEFPDGYKDTMIFQRFYLTKMGDPILWGDTTWKAR